MKKFDRLISVRTNMLVLAICAVLSAACGTPQTPATVVAPASVSTRQPTAPASTALPTVAPTNTQPAATATSAPTASPTTAPQPIVPLPTSTVAMSLAKTGPWLVYQTDRGVIAANPDGSAQRLITDQPILRSDLPDGGGVNGWLALRIGAHGPCTI